MKTRADGVKRAFKPYRQMEINVILSGMPTHSRVEMMAKVLQRSPEAIYMIFELAYSGNWLKDMCQKHPGNNVYRKILLAKRKLGICVGYC